MSIGGGDEMAPASADETSPPYSETEVALADSPWTQEVKRAWSAFQNAEEGDEVLWGDRAQPLTVVQSVMDDDDDRHTLTVEGPRGGTYTLRERYTEEGNPRFYADDSRAMDLRLVDAPEGSDTPFTEQMYERLVENLKRQAINAYVEKDYNTFDAAVRDVVNSWATDVQYERWRGWPYEWEADDQTYIFRMVREHAGRLPEVRDEEQTGSVTPKAQAVEILKGVVYERGQELAHEQLITSQDDYNALVLRLADDAVERSDVKAHMDPREAALSVSEDFVEAHTDPVHRSIIKYGDDSFLDFELYDDMDQGDITREMALDVLDQQVWAQAREEQRERETHDPTIRGLAFYEYDKLVEELVEQTLREHRINGNKMLFTTAREVARDFADQTEREEWPYDFGGVDEDTWGAGDTEDIFASIVLHAEVDPQVFNPFAKDKERRMAVQVLSEVVHNRASNALDEEELKNAPAVPADEYLDDLGLDMSFNDIRNDSGASPEQFIKQAFAAMGDEDGQKLAGWTFVDELVEEGDADVPFAAGPWVLVDFGLVEKDDKDRRLAWFNRDTGGVLQLTGQTTNPPSEGGFGYDDFNVILRGWRSKEPQYLVTDASLDYAFDYATEYVRMNESDVDIIETADGEHYIREAITEDDIDTRAFASIAPSFSMPGPGFSVEDAVTYGSNTFKDLSAWLQGNSRVVSAVTTSATALYLGEAMWLLNRAAPGLNVQPTFDKQRGVGIQGSYRFGASGEEREQYDPEDDDSEFYTGQVKSDIYITPGAFKFIGDSFSPDWLYTAGPGADTVINTLRNRVERPIRDGTGDYFRRERATFVGAHLPAEAEGRPETADDYDGPTEVEIQGKAYDVQYVLDRGNKYPVTEQSTPGNSVESLLMRLVQHGYEVETGGSGYVWPGDEDFQEEMDLEEYGERSKDPEDKNLTPAEVHELGWSMSRDMVLGSARSGRRLIGTTQEVKETWDSKERGPICTYRAFLKVYTEFYGTPPSTMLMTAWKFYKARAQDSDEFTLIDAYDRFRMGLVYDATTGATDEILRERLRNAALGRARAGDDGAAQGQALQAHFVQSLKRTYYWQLTGGLAASNVFDDPSMGSIGNWLIFREDNRPPDSIDHYYADASGNKEVIYKVEDGEHTEANFSPNGSYRLTTNQDLFNALLPSVRNDISEQVADELGAVTDGEDYDPDDPVPEEERKWLQSDIDDRLSKAYAGTVDWDDLDGTDLSIFGLFLRGLRAEDAVRAADNWKLEDRFKTRASDILPSNFEPSRPDLPSFSNWLESRRERNAIGSASEKARQKARYLREMAEEIPGVQSGEAMGTDPTVEEEMEMHRDLLDHHEDTDYTDYEQFYGDEFGEAFDDVAQRYAANRPVDGEGSSMPSLETTDEEVDGQ